MTPREAYIALNLMEGVGPVRVRALMQHFGSVETIFSASPSELRDVRGVGPKLANSIADQRESIDPKAETDRAAQHDCRLLTPIDTDYPAALAEIHDPPLALYLRGSLLPKDRHAIAVIGSRRCSHYGQQVADRLAYQIANAGFTVISGLARGIDKAAHQGALKSQGRTLAVLGSSIDELYPPEHADLADAIARQGGLISEFPLGTQPSRQTFPMRNRIVSGLASGVVVVEAGTHSGAMITVDEATAQGRSIFAVPGRIDSPGAAGCHKLIKQGARLVETVDDILEEFEYLLPPDQAAPKPEPVISPEEEKIRIALEQGTLSIDELIAQTGINPGKLSALLVGLEMKRVVTMLPGRTVGLRSP